MTYTRLFMLVIFVCLSSCNTFQRSSAESWLQYEPSVVELQGNLTEVDEFGPPNFGENPNLDTKVRVPILVLSEPINVRGDPASQLNAESFKGIRDIQLIFSGGAAAYSAFIDRHVVVKGTLFRAESGHHYTDVVLDVTEIRERE
jgi:Domain of unknown function (DUF4431)